MAKSMTGFGMGEFKDENYSITIECKTINHKYLDINPRMPRKISFLEDRLRQLVKEYLGRGRVDIFIKFDTLCSSGVQLIYDRDLAKQYFNILQDIKEDFDIKKEMVATDISKFPDVVKISESEEDEDLLWNMLEKATKDALEKLCEMRQIEGKKLEIDILERAELLRDYINEIEKYSDTVEVEYRDKLNIRIKELLEDSIDVDENRIAQEVAIFADRASITEEIVRFRSHISQLSLTIQKDIPVGRKMDFIIQEMNREANTIGSKSSNIDITNLVISIKSELEKIREQVQNIE